jgi:uncharacterized Ntn-hydrolase superfamily protein
MLGCIRAALTSTRARPRTYSIVARDADTGELGVAVQSHWFSVGPLVPWARPGVGAVATQANVDVAYGPRALDLLQGGEDAQAALAALVAADAGSAGRQVAVVDASGRVAAFTGESCMPAAGHVTGDGVSCQANIMASERVWPAMLEVFSSAEGSLTARLLAALDAAQAAGGDLRGQQSAAILVVPPAGNEWDTVVSLRVEDHRDPLVELRRLVELHDVYLIAGQADELVNQGRYDDASRLYLRAHQLAPENAEFRFWAGLAAAQLGELEAGVRDVDAAIAAHAGWRQLLERLPTEVAPAAHSVRARLFKPDPPAPPG